MSSADLRLRALRLPAGFGLLGRPVIGWRGPRRPVLGTEAVGVVNAVGAQVRRYRVGDEVVVFPGARLGAHAEALCVDENGPVAPKPAALSLVQAAAMCFGGATMLSFFERAGLRAGERVLVTGAAGTVGSAAVQLAHHQGAEVTALCRPQHAELLRTLGADHVLDAQGDDFAQVGRRWDVIVDAAGIAPLRRSAPVLAAGGRLLLVLADMAGLLCAPLAGLTHQRRVVAGPAAEKPRYVHDLATLAAAGHFTPLVDRCFPWTQMRQAHAHAEQPGKRGSVVVLMASAA